MRSLLFLILILAGLFAAACGSTLVAPTSYPKLDVKPALFQIPRGIPACFDATGGDGQYIWVVEQGVCPLDHYSGAHVCYQTCALGNFVIGISSAGQHVTRGGLVTP